MLPLASSAFLCLAYVTKHILGADSSPTAEEEVRQAATAEEEVQPPHKVRYTPFYDDPWSTLL
jgi:hypothetical protein